MITQWNDAEDAALQGCSLLAQVIYLRCLRRCMAYKTGFVGKGHGSAMGMADMARTARFEPDWGSTKKPWVPGKEEIRAALNELKRQKLIEDAGSNKQDGLIFFLLLADTDKSVQKRNPTGTPQEPHSAIPTEEPSNDGEFEDRNHTGTPQDEKPRNPTKPDSVIPEDKKELPIGSSKKNAEAHGTRLPENWVLPDDWYDWAQNELGFSHELIEKTALQFRDYWIAVAGAKGRKANWESTWRNWCRREHERQTEQQRRINRTQTAAERAEARFRAIFE